MDSEGYVPGVCNIGAPEVALRRRFGWIIALLTIALIVLLVRLGVNRLWRLAAFPFAALAATCFIQARLHFCTGYASRGLFNFGSVGHVSRIDDSANRAIDRRRGLTITLWAAAIGLAVTLASLAIS